MQNTPVIHSSTIIRQKYLGPAELESRENPGDFDLWEIVRITLADGTRWILAGTACNTGLIPEYARPWDPGYGSLDEELSEFVADLEDLKCPSADLYRWHGSMVI